MQNAYWGQQSITVRTAIINKDLSLDYREKKILNLFISAEPELTSDFGMVLGTFRLKCWLHMQLILLVIIETSAFEKHLLSCHVYHLEFTL